MGLYYWSGQLSNCQSAARWSAVSKGTHDEKRRGDRNESSAARTIEISPGRRIDTGKIISPVWNNRYYVPGGRR